MSEPGLWQFNRLRNCSAMDTMERAAVMKDDVDRSADRSLPFGTRLVSGRAYQGTCGWTDRSLAQCGRFYPSWVKSPEDRLKHYSQLYPCVEVDSSTYAIPRLDAVDRWIKATPTTFIFHVKAFGLFTNLSCLFNAVPVAVREQFNLEPSRGTDQVRWSALEDPVRQMLWDRFNDCVGAFDKAGKLGVIVFQFQPSFRPTPENEDHLRQCRRDLRSSYRMAIEFRDRAWLAPSNVARTLTLLAELGAATVIIDELKHELLMQDPPLTDPVVLPIQTLLPHTAWAYIRVHRRLGTDKVLRPDEITAWAARLADLTRSVAGPVFFLWGTDHDDQPIKNMANLEKAAGPLIFDWRTSIGGARRSLQAWFGKAATQVDAPQVEAPPADGSLADGPPVDGPPVDGPHADRPKADAHVDGPKADVPEREGLKAEGLHVEGPLAAASSAPNRGSDFSAPPSASAAAALTSPPRSNPPSGAAAKRASPSAPSPSKRRPNASSNAGSITSFFQRAAGPGPSSSSSSSSSAPP